MAEEPTSTALSVIIIYPLCPYGISRPSLTRDRTGGLHGSSWISAPAGSGRPGGIVRQHVVMAPPLPARPLAALPKAHLHLHFTGSMRHSTLVELAGKYRVHLPDALIEDWPPRLRATDERGWFRFQRLYDIARSVLTRPEHVYRLLNEA